MATNTSFSRMPYPLQQIIQNSPTYNPLGGRGGWTQLQTAGGQNIPITPLGLILSSQANNQSANAVQSNSGGQFVPNPAMQSVANSPIFNPLGWLQPQNQSSQWQGPPYQYPGSSQWQGPPYQYPGSSGGGQSNVGGAAQAVTNKSSKTSNPLTAPNVQYQQKKYPSGQASGEESMGDFWGGLLSGGINTLGDILTMNLAKKLAPDVSTSNASVSADLSKNLAELGKWFQYNPLGDIGLAAAVRAQKAYQRNLLTPEVVNNLARAQQAAATLESLSNVVASKAVDEIQKDRRAVVQALSKSGANPAVIASALQNLGAQQGDKAGNIISSALQQAMEGSARAQALRDAAINNLLQQQQISYATRVVPTLNQFDNNALLQAAITPLTTAESRSQNYIIPSNPLTAFATQMANEAQMKNYMALMNQAREPGYWEVLQLYSPLNQQKGIPQLMNMLSETSQLTGIPMTQENADKLIEALNERIAKGEVKF